MQFKMSRRQTLVFSSSCGKTQSIRARSVSLLCFLCLFGPSVPGQQTTLPAATDHPYHLSTSVDRVIVNVGVKDAHGALVKNLHQSDFEVEEDNQQQTIRSFEEHDFDSFEYTPPSLPVMPANTFIDLPHTPERGPLYLLLFDIVNTSRDDQIAARAALMRFLRNKPVGARFAIFVHSDGLHMIQGFTADPQKLIEAVDPNKPKPHFPSTFLMREQFGGASTVATREVLTSIAQFLTPIAGKKNLVWLSGAFPVPLFLSTALPVQEQQDAQQMLNLLSNNQISVFPVDVRGVVPHDEYEVSGAAQFGSSAPPSAGHEHGASLLSGAYNVEDQVAKATGGEAMYSSNDIEGALNKVTHDGGSYYSLSYSPLNKSFNGGLREIKIRVQGENYRLSYRRGYYGSVAPQTKVSANDLTLFMGLGQPELHQLVFGLEIDSGGAARDKEKSYLLTYKVKAQTTAASFEFAAAAAVFDLSGTMLESVSNIAKIPAAESESSKSYRIQQRVVVPFTARFLRIALRNLETGKIGTMEIPLPLAQEK